MDKKAAIIVFITASSEEEATKIATTLVEEKLVACVNIIPKIRSVYWWEGKVCQEDEVMLVSKSTKSLFPAIMDRVKSLHSYQVPEIISFPISEGLPEYLNWIEDVTK
ncbi:MAG: divalent-cation tolerance protein CutA [Thermodesulfobacteriota bacterium]